MLYTLNFKSKYYSLHLPTARFFKQFKFKCKAFLCASDNFSKGSLTLEAALVIPVFILFCSCIIYMFSVLNIETKLYKSMEQAARKSATSTYMAEIPYRDSPTKAAAIYSSVNAFFLKKHLFSDDLISFADSSYISGGHKGINFYLTSYNIKNHTIDFNISYKVKIPFIPLDALSFSVKQRLFFHTFSGEDISDKKGDFTNYVYITLNGSVYHSSPYCTYLMKSASILSEDTFNSIMTSKNSFSPCSNCVKKGSNTSNYLYCPSSCVYHTRYDCFYLNADIYKVTLESVYKDYKICSRCLKKQKE